MAKLLIVDDDRDVCRLVGLLLQFEGHQATWLTDGEAALRFLEEQQPNLVLLDIMMPGLDGIEVLRQIRTNPRLRDVKVVMYTAVSDATMHHEAENLGAAGYVLKGAAWASTYSELQRHLN